ncbi:MAG: Re/Si-specific NAD(P)(+) transhydrogenase subunit alpha, partial [Proteobacteria bacterium]|nr:Re/Si-specific NAD(P)(+) transhydrogenase subunit alpha [Pseudomonadota bacterium]
MKIAVLKEAAAGERRVSATPETVKKFVALGAQVAVEQGAGDTASIADQAYADMGAAIGDRAATLKDADIVLGVQGPDPAGLTGAKPGAWIVAGLNPFGERARVDAYASGGFEALAMELMPRITRAQSMDILSSQSNLSGYKAVLDAAAEYGRAFPMMMTAAGTVSAAKVFVMGVGVAGLQAIATARRLGAQVSATDVRAATREQILSLGAKPIFVEAVQGIEGEGTGGYATEMSDEYKAAQAELVSSHIAKQDIVITTALIPGRPAPRLISDAQIATMKPGSVIVDMAAEQGGNCELTEPGKAVVKHGVTIIGYTDLASRLAKQSSTLYATNLLRLTEELCKAKDGQANVNMEDDAIRGLTVVKEGNITWPAPPLKPVAAPAAKPAAAPVAEKKGGHGHGSSGPLPAKTLAILFAVCALAFWFIGAYAPAAFLGHFTVFVLACFIGYMVVWNVTPALHTPLMSVTNAISSIIVIGALIQIAPPDAGANGRPDQLILWLAFAGI